MENLDSALTELENLEHDKSVKSTQKSHILSYKRTLEANIDKVHNAPYNMQNRRLDTISGVDTDYIGILITVPNLSTIVYEGIDQDEYVKP